MKKIVLTIFTICLVTVLTSSIVFAYTLISHGYKSKSIPIEHRIVTYNTPFENARDSWNNAGIDVCIYKVTGSGNNYITSDQVADTWYGQYEALMRENIFWGKATKFKITINRNTCVSESDEFVQSVICHELGHALSLGDQEDSSDCIMGYERDRNTLITPQSDDIEEILSAY